MSLIQQTQPELVHIEPAQNALASHLIGFHDTYPGQSQILSSIKDGPNGIHGINQILSKQHAGPFLLGISIYPIGAPIVVTKNIPALGLDNGTLGYVGDTRTISFPDGAQVLAQDILDHIMPAYALTIHKAQGSQWNHICLVIGKSRLLDRSLLYTAATRASKTMTIIGKAEDIRTAVQTPPRVFGTQTALLERIGTSHDQNS